MAGHVITIPLQRFHGNVVLVEKKEYEDLKRKATERDKLVKKEMKHVAKIIKAGEAEFRAGKTKAIKSSAELVK